MTLIDRISLLSPFDAAALAILIVTYIAVGWRIEHPGKKHPSVTVLMESYRRDWMRETVTRDVRIFDAQILGNLRQGTAFFASTCILAIGGVLALLGNTDPLNMVATELGREDVPGIVWQLKLIVVVLFLTNGFLKFAWANRMFGYFAVLVAAIPNDPTAPDAMPRAMQAAEINIRAARNFNRGLRAIYFSLGALAWLLGATALLIATGVVLLVVWEREFMSGGRQTLLQDMKVPE